MKKEELEKILEEHKLWLDSDGKEGEKADLRRANLYMANLGGTDLERADLVMVNLEEANLYRAYLIDADLRRAILRGADLIVASLRSFLTCTTRKNLPAMLN